MIIEIKDIPENQKIEKICIEFQSNDIQAKTQPKIEVKTELKEPKKVMLFDSVQSVQTERKPSEVPQEMLNEEF